MALNRENVIRAAEKYVAKGKLEAAIKEYRKVLAENPNDANTLNRVGDLYARIERFDEAVKLFSQIAEQYTRDGFFVKAIAIYKKIIKLDPTSLTVYERLAELYHKQGLLNEARTQYQVLADYYVKHDNAASAITIYQRMAEFEPDNPSFHLKLAELFESQRLTDKAMKEYRLLADLLIVGGSVEEAVQVYLKALEVSSSDLDFVRDAVSGLHDTGHVSGAATVLARAVELNPEASELAQQIGLAGDDSAEELAEVPTEAPEETSSFEIPDADDAFDTGNDFTSEEAFEIPATSFDGLEEALEESGISMVAEEPADDVFTFDLDDDEPPASLVTPPADMLEPEATAVDAPAPSSSVDVPAPDISADAPAPDISAASDDDFDIDLDFDITPGEPETESPAASTAGGDEFEIDWPLDGAEDDVELPSTPVASGDPEPAFDLDDTVPSHRITSAVEPLELEGFELGEPSLEPVEHVAATSDVADTEGEVDLDGLDLESMDFEPAVVESPVEATKEAPADDAAEVQAQFDQRREEDLLAEAKVFFKYGLQEKARDRLGELFQVRPEHLEGLDLQTRIDLEAGQLTEAMASANLVSRIAGSAGDADTWASLKAVLTKAGFTMDGDQVIGEPGKKLAGDDRIAQLLDDLSLEAYDAPVVASHSDEIPLPQSLAKAAAKAADEVVTGDEDTVSVEPEVADAETVEPAAAEPGVAEPDVVEAVAAEPDSTELDVVEAVAAEPDSAEPDVVEPDSAEPDIVEPVAAEPVAAEPDTVEPDTVEPDTVEPDAVAPEPVEPEAIQPTPPASGAGDLKLISLVEELGLDDLEETLDDELAASPEMADQEPVTPAPAPAADPLDETGMSWLDDLESEREEASSEEEKIFEEEDDFFDLAAELERELSEDEGAGADAAQGQEQSLEDIIEGFKQGVAENLSPEDYDTHFNLGIAYREMGLLDEAIGEFQLAAKDERYVVDSSSLLGICFLDKGLPELAVRSYRKGLAAPTISDDATLGLLYDMGSAYLSLGDSDAAYKTFIEVYGLNSHYRDVATKVEELSADS